MSAPALADRLIEFITVDVNPAVGSLDADTDLLETCRRELGELLLDGGGEVLVGHSPEVLDEAGMERLELGEEVRALDVLRDVVEARDHPVQEVGRVLGHAEEP